MKFNCDCEWTEQPNQTGTVKGSVLVTECEECKTKREQANADRAAKEAKALALKEVEDLIEAKKRDLAVEALKVDGILDSDAKITPAGKEFLAGDKKPIK